jgi:hypothetical protein
MRRSTLQCGDKFDAIARKSSLKPARFRRLPGLDISKTAFASPEVEPGL